MDERTHECTTQSERLCILPLQASSPQFTNCACMKSQVPSQTSNATHTTPNTADGSRSSGLRKRFGVRWVYPQPRVSILEDKITLGRSPDCDVTLPGGEVSRVHAHVTVCGRSVELHDQPSHNGVFVDGRRVASRQLASGDVIRMGEWVGVAGSIREDEPGTPKFEALYSGWYGGVLLEERMHGARNVARSDWSIVIQGETGTGKEGAARAIHDWSGRSGLFVAVDCGALASQLAESQLFGHCKGAFTGADRAAPGYFRAAQNGTIFLDEILNLSLPLQAKLLRVLEDGNVTPVGQTQSIPVNARVISAAQTPLSEAVAAGVFRMDLMMRLQGSCSVIELPVLRERREDIYPLFRALFQRHSDRLLRCDAKFVESLLLYRWPGNVRELSQLTKYLLAQHVEADDTWTWTKLTLPLHIRQALDPAPLSQAQTEVPRTVRVENAAKRKPKYDESDFEACLKAEQEHGGNAQQASKALGWSRSRFNRVKQKVEALQKEPEE